MFNIVNVTCEDIFQWKCSRQIFNDKATCDNNMEQGYKLWKMKVASSSGIFKTSSQVSYLLLFGKIKLKNSMWMISLTLKYAPSF